MNLAAARKHEGACGAAFDNPELIVAAVVGDGEAETGQSGNRTLDNFLARK